MAKKTRARADRTKRGHYQIGSKRPKLRHRLNTPGFEYRLLHFVGVYSDWDNHSAKQLLYGEVKRRMRILYSVTVP